MRTLLIISMFICHVSGLVAQFDLDYQPMEIKGSVPDAILQHISEPAFSSPSDFQADGLVAATTKDMRSLLLSGSVFFNDDQTEYLGRILDKLLESEPLTRDSITVMTMNFGVPRAIIWPSGLLLVDHSLVLAVKNEAQLAFLLDRQVALFRAGNVLLKAPEDPGAPAAVFNRGNAQRSLVAGLGYSAEADATADLVAYDHFRNAGYDWQAAEAALRAIHDPGLLPEAGPIDLEAHFGLARFNINLSSAIAAGKAAHNDSLARDPGSSDSGLPHFETRLAELRARTGKPAPGEKFVLPRKRFEFAQQVSRFEEIHRLYKSHEFTECLFLALHETERFPENRWLHEITGGALFWLYTYRYADLEIATRRAGSNPEFERIQQFLLGIPVPDLGQLTTAYLHKWRSKAGDSETLDITFARASEWAKNPEQSIRLYEKYLNQYPNGKYRQFAHNRLAEL